MTRSVDLNADMGEGFGPWTMGDDEGLLDIVTSVNVACGMHAGDWDVMERTFASASARNLGLGAHPGFPDLQGFGRRRIDLAAASIGNLVAYQVGAARGIAAKTGSEIRHVKLHGALANMASEDEALARVCYEAALAVAPEIIVMVMAGTAQQSAAAALGCRVACEIFADRAYTDDATLVDRTEPGAVIRAPQRAARRVVDMIEAGAILSESGKRIPTRIDTVCLHGDTPAAVSMARAVREGLAAAGIGLAPFPGTPL
ncbi:MAG: 5-oxoprolinase subunit PxpA [Paracoccaceae bacterium]|nr:5-oxoprolinase subunit PxpA [Paracoccaceae bacterium]